MRRAWIIGVVVSAFAIALTWIATDVRLFQFATVASLAIAMLGLNLLTGFNGQISLGHGAFMGIGAYGAAILVRDQGMSYPLAMVIAFVICFVVGGLLGIPALRLPGTSLALITVALALAFPQIIKKYSSVTNGVGGITTPPGRQFRAPTSGFMSGLTNDQFRYLVFTLIAIVLFWLAWNIVRGRWGLAMMSVRDNPVSAASMGVNLPRTKVVTFAISAGYAGIGGAVLVMATGFVGPDNFGVAVSISILTGVVIGGLGTIAGAVIGGLFVQFLPYYSNEISQSAPTVVYGVIIILVMILAPGGVIGLLRRFGAWFSGKRGGSSKRDIEAAEVQASFPTTVDEPVPSAHGL
jgi:branched-chain amino acid transport system permease protein